MNKLITQFLLKIKPQENLKLKVDRRDGGICSTFLATIRYSDAVDTSRVLRRKMAALDDAPNRTSVNFHQSKRRPDVSAEQGMLRAAVRHQPSRMFHQRAVNFPRTTLARRQSSLQANRWFRRWMRIHGHWIGWRWMDHCFCCYGTQQ